MGELVQHLVLGFRVLRALFADLLSLVHGAGVRMADRELDQGQK